MCTESCHSVMAIAALTLQLSTSVEARVDLLAVHRCP